MRQHKTQQWRETRSTSEADEIFIRMDGEEHSQDFTSTQCGLRTRSSEAARRRCARIAEERGAHKKMAALQLRSKAIVATHVPQ